MIGSVYEHRGLKVGVFLDAGNIQASVRDTFPGKEPDHRKLLDLAVADNKLHRALAYCVPVGDNFEAWKNALGRRGFEFRVRDVQHFDDGSKKADIDMALAMDVWRLIDEVDMVVLMTGDGDFTELVERCKELGKPVRVVAVERCTNRNLVAAADEFVPITENDLRARKKSAASRRS